MKKNKINKNYHKLIRDRLFNFENMFIYKQIAKRIIDSIEILSLPFNNILEIGINDNEILSFLKKKHVNSSIIRSDISNSKFENHTSDKYKIMDLDNWDFKTETFDMIYSNFFIHLSNDFEKLLKNIFSSLKPNGFFIATMPGPLNLYQLKNSMIKTDIDLYGGAYQRFNHNISVEEIFNKLKKENFSIPVIDVDKIFVEYSSFQNLLKDIRVMKLGNIYKNKKNNFEKKKYFKKVEKNYSDDYFINSSFPVEIEILIVSGWKSKNKVD